MITKKTKYALRALIYLTRAHLDRRGAVLIAEIAETELIPKKFLENILVILKNQGILQSKKGKGGGYFLAQDPRHVSVSRILRLLDGPLAPVSCVSEMAYAPCPECRDERICGIRQVMKGVRDAMAGMLDGTSLEDLVRLEDRAARKLNRP